MSKEYGVFGDIHVTLDDDFVAIAEVRRGPHNFFDKQMIADLATAFEGLDKEPGARAIVLCAEGKNFCAGANFASKDRGVEDDSGRHLYDEAVRLFSTRTPVVAAINGAAIGGGLGLALMPDFRVASPESRFAANFARLGFHHGFALSVTLPRLVGQQHAMDLLYTGRRVKGDEAATMGLCDRLVPADKIREEARAFAVEIALSAPLAVDSIRETLRGGLADDVRRATDREKAEQGRLWTTQDHQEGIKATAERRTPNFIGA